MQPKFVDLSEKEAEERSKRFKHVISSVDYGPKMRRLRWPEHCVGANIAYLTAALREIGGFHPLLGYTGPLLLTWDENYVSVKLTSLGWETIYSPYITVLHLLQPKRAEDHVVQLRHLFNTITHMILAGIEYKLQGFLRWVESWVQQMKHLPCSPNTLALQFCNSVSSRFALVADIPDALDRVAFASDRLVRDFMRQPDCETGKVSIRCGSTPLISGRCCNAYVLPCLLWPPELSRSTSLAPTLASAATRLWTTISSLATRPIVFMMPPWRGN